MKKLNFKTTEEFEEVFRGRNLEVTRAIVDAIEKAMVTRKRSAKIFEITFDGSDYLTEISLPKSQWPDALQSCLDVFHEKSLSDECIDTWKLLEASKIL